LIGFRHPNHRLRRGHFSLFPATPNRYQGISVAIAGQTIGATRLSSSQSGSIGNHGMTSLVGAQVVPADGQTPRWAAI